MMKYTTRYYGSPYGADGEQGGETTTPLKIAAMTLHPGQRLDCYRGSDEAQTTPVKRYVCGADGQVHPVTL